MASFSVKNIINPSKKDLKKAALKANKQLESRNKSLEKAIKDQEKQLKFSNKEYNSEYKKLNKLLIDIEFQQDKFQKINSGVYSSEKLLKSKFEKVSNAEEELCKYESIVEELEDREIKLKKDIESLEFYKAKCSQSKDELAGIKAKKDDALNDLNDITSEVNSIKSDGEEKISYYESRYDSLEKKAKEHEDMVYRFEQRLFDAKDQAFKEEKILENIKSKLAKEKNRLNEELRAVKNLINNTEDKYIKWEQKLAKITVKADKEELRIKKAKERFEKWRIGILEEVARMKLKKKVDTINKAGLSEILNG